jgi:retinol dehydrogenase 12
MITGAASGMGLELAKMLYSKNGTVWIVARSNERAQVGIDAVKTSITSASSGRLMPLAIDFANLATIKPAAQSFLAQSPRLDVLFLNHGVMRPPKGSKSIDVSRIRLFSLQCLSRTA